MNIKNVTMTLFLDIFFESLNTEVLLMFHTKLQSNIPNDSGEEANFVVLAIVSNGQIVFSTDTILQF